MKASRLAVSALVLALAWSGVASAASDVSLKKRPRPAHAQITDIEKRIDINNINMAVTNTGSFAFDKTVPNGGQGLEFPRGTGKTAVFAAGLWVGGKVGGNIRISVAEYSDDFQAGPAVGGVPDDFTKPEYKVYKLNRVYADPAVRDADLADYVAGAVPHGAPAVTVQGDGTLSILGDQMLWAVYNDFSFSGRNRASTKLPLGVEVQQATFAFDRQGPLGNTVFMKYRIINRNAVPITEMYVSQWSDPDLGGAADDLVGCDTTLSLGYVYNATANDEQYASTSPAVGFDFLQGPKVGATILGLSSFNKYINGTDPDDSTKTYNYMQGKNADGSPLINPTNGQTTRFFVSGDPVAGDGWLDTAPADRRLMLSSGPFTMAPGDTQEVVVGLVIAQGGDRLSSIALMKCFDASVQAAYDADFDLPSPPSSPAVTATTRSSSAFLSWSSDVELNYHEGGYLFEGYNVYQGASIAGPWTRLNTYDAANGITKVFDTECDQVLGIPVPVLRTFGTDAGLRYRIEISEDRIRGGPLRAGTTYYFAVTGYAVDQASTPRVLESSFNVLSIVPQSPPAGVDLGSTQITDVEQLQTTPGPAATTDVVTAEIVDAASVITADYRVGFKPNGAGYVWYVVRTIGTQVDTVVNNFANVTADEASPVVDGVQIKVLSYPPGELGRVAYVDTAGGNPAALVGDDLGLRFFGGGADYAADLFGSGIPSRSVGPNVTIRFGPPGQKGYRYLRCDCSPRTYLIQDFVDVPFTVWDTDTGTQLNVCWLENEPDDFDDGIWSPATVDYDHREILWINASAYSTTVDSSYFGRPLPDFEGWEDALSGVQDFLYFVWPDRVTDTAVIDEGDKLVFTTSIPSTPNDYFTFSTTRANQMNAALAKSELSNVKAVPNPYFSHSTYELNQFNRVVKFTHLPVRCTIRLFNLAGDLVRTIEKNDNTSQVNWNLMTENGLPVGSGIYIFHVDAPGIGTTTGKVAIFMERERLNVY